MKPVKIIAEAGVNHNGDMTLAKKLIDVAQVAGADVVKFQTFRAKNLVTKNADMAEYQKANMGQEQGKQFDMIHKLELSKDNHLELQKYCQERKIEFLSTPFDTESIHLLANLGINTLKIPSGEINNLPFLRTAIKHFKEFIFSTGMSDEEEIAWILDFFSTHHVPKSNITLLHCNTEYPTPFTDVNLLAMSSLAKKFGVNVGYSDHSLGIEVPIAAVALGATVIEKHFTLDKGMEGPDHKASLDPSELANMVSSIRHIEQALGSREKFISPQAKKNMLIAKKSIVALRSIKIGDVFSENNLTTKRPGTGINPRLWDKVIGQKAVKDFDEDELIEI